MVKSVRPLTFVAIVPLVFSVLALTAAPASAATESDLSATAYGGDDAQIVKGRQVPHQGSFTGVEDAGGVTGDEGSASARASQTATAGPKGISATGAGQVTANPVDDDAHPSGFAESEYRLEDWSVPASGQWRVKLALRNTGTGDCGGPTIGSVRAGMVPIVDGIIYCNDGPYDRDVTVPLSAGDKLNVHGFLSIHIGDGGQNASWTLSVTPVSLDPAPKPKVVKPKASAAPAISGTPRVGKKLKATLGKWRNDPKRFTFQWLRQGKKISGATSPTYKLKKADKGKKVSVRVTAQNKADKASSTSKAVKVKKAKKAKKKSKKNKKK